MTASKKPELDDANVTTSLPEADSAEDKWTKLQTKAETPYRSDSLTPKPHEYRGRFSGGAGIADLGHVKSVASWVIFTLEAADLNQAAADILMAWKVTESQIPHPLAEFTIHSWKGSPRLHGVLEVGEYLDSSTSHEPDAPLRIARQAMNAIAKELLAKGYECPPQ